jgi:hypothetical protein
MAALLVMDEVGVVDRPLASAIAAKAALDVAAYITPHNCAECSDCIHDGNKCCGCYDGACCVTSSGLGQGS